MAERKNTSVPLLSEQERQDAAFLRKKAKLVTKIMEDQDCMILINRIFTNSRNGEALKSDAIRDALNAHLHGMNLPFDFDLDSQFASIRKDPAAFLGAVNEGRVRQINSRREQDYGL